jgi:hypothetical protein
MYLHEYIYTYTSTYIHHAHAYMDTHMHKHIKHKHMNMCIQKHAQHALNIFSMDSLSLKAILASSLFTPST